MKTRAMLSIAACAGALWTSEASGIPVPRLTHEQLVKVADVVVEGRVASVTLTKRWVGDRPGIDVGYENGHFEVSFLVAKAIKGDVKPGQTLRYFVHAYMEGKWDKPPPMGFVYEGTVDAVTPGTKLRVYLNWDKKQKRYQRAHFNSGFVVLGKSDREFPITVGVPVSAGAREPENRVRRTRSANLNVPSEP